MDGVAEISGITMGVKDGFSRVGCELESAGIVGLTEEVQDPTNPAKRMIVKYESISWWK